MTNGSREKTDLSRQLRAEDKKRLGDLYMKYHRRVCGYIIRYGVRESIAEDLTQNVFIQLCSDYIKGRRIRNFEKYLFGIARYLIYEHRRHASRLPILLLGGNPEDIVSAFSEGTSGNIVKKDGNVRSISMEILEKVVADLPGKYREAFELRYIRNLPISVAAQEAGCSRNTFCQRIHHAVKMMRLKLRLL